MAAGTVHSPRAVARTLVTGATGFIGWHVVRQLLARGDEVVATVRDSPAPPADGARGPHRTRRHPRPPLDATGDARGDAGVPRRRDHRAQRPRARIFAVQRGGDADRARGGAAGGGRAGRPHLLGGRDRAGAPGEGRRGQPWEAGRYGIAYLDAKHEAEVDGAAPGRPRAAAGDRQPGARARSRLDPGRSSHLAGPALHAPPDPRLRRRHAERRRRGGRGTRPPAGRRARPDRRALHPGQPQLHPRPAVRRPRPALRDRAAGRQAAARRGAGAERGRPAPAGRGRSPAPTRSAPPRSTGRSSTARPNASSAGDRPRTRTAWRRRSTGTASRMGRCPPGRPQPLALRLAGWRAADVSAC